MTSGDDWTNPDNIYGDEHLFPKRSDTIEAALGGIKMDIQTRIERLSSQDDQQMVSQIMGPAIAQLESTIRMRKAHRPHSEGKPTKQFGSQPLSSLPQGEPDDVSKWFAAEMEQMRKDHLDDHRKYMDSVRKFMDAHTKKFSQYLKS